MIIVGREGNIVVIRRGEKIERGAKSQKRRIISIVTRRYEKFNWIKWKKCDFFIVKIGLRNNFKVRINEAIS